MPAAAPERLMPLAVTVLPVPAAEESKLPVPLQVTTSLPTTPVRVQLMAALEVPS